MQRYPSCTGTDIAPEPSGLRGAVELWLAGFPRPEHADPLDLAGVRMRDLDCLCAVLDAASCVEPPGLRAAAKLVVESRYPKVGGTVSGQRLDGVPREYLDRLRAALAAGKGGDNG